MEDTITAYFCHCLLLSRLASLGRKVCTTASELASLCQGDPGPNNGSQAKPQPQVHQVCYMKSLPPTHHKGSACPSQGEEYGTQTLRSVSHVHMTAAIRTLWAPDKYDFLHTIGGYTHFPRWAHFTILFPVAALFISQFCLFGRKASFKNTPTPHPIQSPPVQSLVP